MPSLTLDNQTFNTWTPGTDSMVLVLGTQEPNSVVTNCQIDGNGAEWGLKMPGNTGSIISNSKLVGGKERALDIVQGSNTLFSHCEFGAGADRRGTTSKWSFSNTCDIGIKGGATNVRFEYCTITDVLLGDHSIYDNPSIGPKTKGITLVNCVHPNGADTPIILRVMNAEMPALVNTNAVALVYWGPVVKTYFWIAGKWIDSRLPPK